jgi:hypothetical protein
MVCPNCEATNVLLSAEDAAKQGEQLSLERERERREFLDALSRVRGTPSYGSGGYRTPIEGGQSDLALMAARRLKDVSVYLLAFAYLLLLIPVVLGFCLFMWAGLPGLWGGFAFGTGVFVGATVFIVFKYMSDTVRALADLTDLQRGVDARLADLQRVAEAIAVKPDMSDGDRPKLSQVR